jgi:hypothetical protein
LGATSLRYTAGGFSRFLRAPHGASEFRFAALVRIIQTRMRVTIAALSKCSFISSMFSSLGHD